MVQSIKSFF